ncbi:MAG: serine hydrolase [Candidatus Binataceae bacterium]
MKFPHIEGRWAARASITMLIAAVLFAVGAAVVRASTPAAVRGLLTASELEPIAAIVQQEIDAGHIPGAVVMIGNHGRVVYDRAFGFRSLKPLPLKMTADTIFDLASLTKVVATTTAVMRLVEQGRMKLDERVASYWPEFAANGKAAITVRELLTHYSGLRADLNLNSRWSGYNAALARIIAQRPVCQPGACYVYSDINFEVLGELVRRVSGRPLDRWCEREIFSPLRMNDTAFCPDASMDGRIAPTEVVNGKLLIGEVHDPSACRMGGVSGHAGLFSTAHDLAIFAQMMLDGGRDGNQRILGQGSVDEMTAPASPAAASHPRGLGWDLGPALASNREQLPPVGSYGHTGFTGTMLWVDPPSRTYVVILTNRVYPDGRGDAHPLRANILDLVSRKLGPASAQEIVASNPDLRGYFEPTRAAQANPPASKPAISSGLDVLVAENFAPLRGLHVGLITNHSGVDYRGERGIDLMRSSPALRLTTIFTPEHGLAANLEGAIDSGSDAASGLPVLSLYGPTKRPTDGMLDGLDALVFDVQDAGARFYTYASTMAYTMEAAAQRGIDFYVLDRPNPLTAAAVQGPLMDADLRSFTGYYPLPVRHGMTIGELAQLFNTEAGIGAHLHVIAMKGYERREWYDETGLPWIPPSPNLRTITQAVLYPGVALVEGANVSVGRGTAAPFEQVGAPWIDGVKLSTYLNRRSIRGVAFAPVEFTPASAPYKGRLCRGVRITLIDRQILDSPELGIEIASALERQYPDRFRLSETLGMIGARWVLSSLRDGHDPRTVARQWQSGLISFRAVRDKYLLY